MEQPKRQRRKVKWEAGPNRVTVVRVNLTRSDARPDGALVAPTMVVSLLLPAEPMGESIRVLLTASEGEGVAFHGEVLVEIGFSSPLPKTGYPREVFDFMLRDGVPITWNYLFTFLDSVLSQMGLPPLRFYGPTPDTIRESLRKNRQQFIAELGTGGIQAK